MNEPFEIRPATDADRPEILQLAQRALGWTGDARDRSFFEWKHDHNPFGPSPAWVAADRGGLVGFRTFLRWELERAGRSVRCVRAVDTATDPEAQGRGVFRALTLHALDALEADGVQAIFNTPNERSRPGYLKMGWRDLGRPDLDVVPHSPRSLLRMLRSRAPADKWSDPVTHGSPALEVLRDSQIGLLLRRLPPGPEWTTARSPDFLRWRYSFGPLHYRGAEVRGGICIFRVRRRGPSTEVAICEWLSPEADPLAIRRIVRSCGADYAVGIGLGALRQGALRVPRRGPMVTWRPLTPDLDVEPSVLGLRLGDLELF